MTDHVITTRWLGCDHVKVLSREQFREAERAKELLLACLALEESYDVVLLNYSSFETGILANTIKTIITRGQTRHELEELRRDLDRHLVNLLASGEMYVAHADRLLRAAPRRKLRVDVQAATARRAALKADLLGFQAMKWLRDAALHQTLPISSWGFESTWTDEAKGPNSRRQHSFSARFDQNLLSSLRDLPPDISEALKARANREGQVEWRPLVREYVEGVSQLHEAMRDGLSAGEQAARTLLEQMVVEYRAHFGGEKPASVVAARRDASGGWVESFALDFDYPERIHALRRRNRALVNLRDLEIVS